MTCHTLKHAESMQTSLLFVYLRERSFQRGREMDYRRKYVWNLVLLLVYPGEPGCGTRTTPAFPFYALINVVLSSKRNCNRWLSALIAEFSRLSRCESSHNNNKKREPCKYRITAEQRNKGLMACGEHKWGTGEIVCDNLKDKTDKTAYHFSPNHSGKTAFFTTSLCVSIVCWCVPCLGKHPVKRNCPPALDQASGPQCLTHTHTHSEFTGITL